ncbi:hypothetical protein F4805DRAFT_199832 [Annulohypoxylon moriforme]|nr:hypothetical protein F4805DRAFT_199832 [Annulohypoxylon moriforme]
MITGHSASRPFSPFLSNGKTPASQPTVLILSCREKHTRMQSGEIRRKGNNTRIRQVIVFSNRRNQLFTPVPFSMFIFATAYLHTSGLLSTRLELPENFQPRGKGGVHGVCFSTRPKFIPFRLFSYSQLAFSLFFNHSRGLPIGQHDNQHQEQAKQWPRRKKRESEEETRETKTIRVVLFIRAEFAEFGGSAFCARGTGERKKLDRFRATLYFTYYYSRKPVVY